MSLSRRLVGGLALGLFAQAALLAANQAGAVMAPWLIGTQALGWIALALAWRATGEGPATPAVLRVVVAGAIGFRLLGWVAVPTWEDDYFRHVWDGWLTWRTGSPYGIAPLAWFGVEEVPIAMQAVLDGVNHPEHATIYGPVAQVWSAAAAALGAGWETVFGPLSPGGQLAIFKAGLLAAEAVALRAVWRLAGTRALLFAAWCPLAVLEIAFAGHVDALALGAVATALLAATRGRPGAAGLGLAVAVATKPYALLLAPFLLWRGGWRGVTALGATLAALYLPWLLATAGAGRAPGAVFGLGGVGTMAMSFEFNSTGYAVWCAFAGEQAGRWLAAICLGLGWLVIGWRWRRRGAEVEATPGVAVVGWWALWSPVFHPWYALLALPFLARRPVAWGVGLLLALPLSYAHGLTLGAAGGGDFRHPGWVRPLEVAVVVVAAGVGWRARRRDEAAGG